MVLLSVKFVMFASLSPPSHSSPLSPPLYPLTHVAPSLLFSFLSIPPPVAPSNVTPEADTERDPFFIVAVGQRHKHRAGTVTPVIKERMFSVKALQRGASPERQRSGKHWGMKSFHSQINYKNILRGDMCYDDCLYRHTRFLKTGRRPFPQV